MKSTYHILFLLFFISCNKKQIGPQFKENSPLSGYKILVLNEGNFGFGNATITAYNPYSKQVGNNSFISKNGFQLGDVLQSGASYKGNYYFVLNNSSKIIITDSIDLTYKHQITGFNSPRYITFYNNKAFVSDLREGVIYVVDLSSKTISNTIPATGWTEQLIIHNNTLYALDRGNYLNNTGNNKIYLINPNTNQKTDSIAVPLEPNSMEFDKNGNLWVLCSGGFGVENAQLIKINVVTKQIEKNFTFPNINHSPSRLCMNNDGDVLYYLNKNVYRLSIYDNNLPFNFHINGNENNFYGLTVDKNTNQLYLTDAKDYLQNGTLYRYYENGNLIDKISTGIIPQNIVF